MCGIAGIWRASNGSGDLLEIVRRMGAALEHRGPDDSGVYQDISAKLGLAFRRLSIIDLSAEGHQPMFSASKRFVIVFNGEVYNYEEIRKELGHLNWRGHSDTEVMLEAIERWGLQSAVQRFVGMFAFALWDTRERKLHLVRDRLGIKPLYYGRVGADFVFGSELKAIQQHPDFEGEIDRGALGLYMRHKYVPAPYCIFQGLHKLLPGYTLTVAAESAEPELNCFWSAREVARQGKQAPFAGTAPEAIQQLHDKLLEAIRLRMIADVPLGAFLSGGVDSSTMVALMQAQSGRPVKTFTIGFGEGQFNEAAHAKRVACHLGTDHTELFITGQDALDAVPLLPEIYDEPFADSSQIPTYLVSKLARRHVTVSLSGDGGDELFGGYSRYAWSRSIWRVPAPARFVLSGALHKIPAERIDRMYGAIRSVLPPKMRVSSPGDKAHKFASYMHAGTREELYLNVLSHWEDPSRVVIGCREPKDVLKSIYDSSWLESFDEIMMLTDLLNYLPGDVLTKVDRASMAVSLEARVPILDHRVVEFAWRLPLNMKVRGQTSKWILREVLDKYVPRELIERPKKGFSVPIGEWLRGPLRQWAEDLLSESRLQRRGLFNPKPIREKWREHLSGTRNWEHLLWEVLIFNEWSLNTSLRRDVVPARS